MKKPASFEAAVEESSKKKFQYLLLKGKSTVWTVEIYLFNRGEASRRKFMLKFSSSFLLAAELSLSQFFSVSKKKAFSGTRWVSFPSSFFLFLSSRCHMEVEEDRILKEK